MPGIPVGEPVTAAVLAGLDPNSRPDGHRVVVVDDGNVEWEARGADGARVWVELHLGLVVDHEADADPHGQYLTQPEADGLYDAAGTAAAGDAGHLAAGDPHGQYLTQSEGDALYVGVGTVTHPQLVTTETDVAPPVTVWTEDGTDWVYTEA